MKPRRLAWSPDDVARLQALYPTSTPQELEAAFGKKIQQIYHKAHLLQLKKSAAYYAAGHGGRTDGTRGAGSRFAPGHTTWNKGAKGWQAGGRAPATQFRPGNMPHNTRHVGSYRIDKTGTLQRKIGTAKGSNSKRWRGVHELVWIAAHGPLPEGHIAVFRPGMKTAVLEDITLDRIECISRAENMRRNSYHNYGPEIAKCVQLRGALTRQINKRANHEQ